MSSVNTVGARTSAGLAAAALLTVCGAGTTMATSEPPTRTGGRVLVRGRRVPDADPGDRHDRGHVRIPHGPRGPHGPGEQRDPARRRPPAQRRADVAPDPVVELGGGPGFSSLVDIEQWAGSRILAHRDVILFDQRGLGFSEPNLDCPETDEAVWQVFATNDAPAEEGEVLRASMDACRAAPRSRRRRSRRLRHDPECGRRRRPADRPGHRGVEPARRVLRGRASPRRSCAITPRASARRCSTRSFRSTRRSAASTAARVLCGRSTARWPRWCAASPSCTESFGDLRMLIADAAATLDADPYEVTITDPLTVTSEP